MAPMNPTPLPDALRALLVARHFDESFPPAGVDALLDALEHVRLPPGATLLRQGEPGDDLYLILAGQVSVTIERTGAVAALVDEIGAGGVVGEMALLTGLARTATVRSLETCELARLSRVDFEALAARFPRLLQEFLHRILPRLRRVQLLGVLTELFGELDRTALGTLEAELEWVTLGSGAELFAEGDAGDDVYIVVNGRLRVGAADHDHGERILEEVGRGGAVGELGLLTGEPRAATVVAVRDSDLLRLSKAAFERLLDRHPRAMMQIARTAAARLRRSARRVAQPSRAPRSFALVAARPDVPIADLAARLAEVLGASASALRLSSGVVDRLLARPGIAQVGEDTVIHEAVVAWLSSQERDHGFMVLEADPEWTPWTRRCLRQADRVLIVGRAGDDPALGPVERALADAGVTVPQELVLLHDPSQRPVPAGPWLDARTVAAHHHIRVDVARDIRRLARCASGRATGLVLGGGGARGFAHIGMLRALDEAGIEIDVVGGTSIGALIAAAYAAGISVDAMIDIARTFASPKKLLDRTLPITSLMAGRKVTALYRQLFGSTSIEDLWTSYFAVSSGLSRAQTVVHRRGSLWQAVRASTAIPAIFPPMLGDEGEILVDGNVMNNMPLDVMRGICEEGLVFAMNPMPTHDKLRSYRFGPSLSGWEALLGRLGLFGSRTRAPSILGCVMRATEINSANRMRQPSFRALADLLVEPAVESFPILAFAEYAPIIDIGYRAAADALAAWRQRGGAAPI
jgi:NTE family protein/lysophospholipid hydrolase